MPLYVKTVWVNDQAPARDATNLNKQEDGILANSIHAESAHAPSDADNTSSNQTSHADVVVDGDFASNGVLFRTSLGVYSIKVIGTDIQAYNANTTTQGNTFNGNDQLVQLNASGELPAINGSNLTGLASGFADPMTTRGDVICRNASNATARLPLGTTGYVVGSDGTDVVWVDNLNIRPKTVQFSGIHDNGTRATNWTFEPVHGNYQKVTMSGNQTLTIIAPNGPTTLWLHITQSGAGNTLTLPSGKWAGGTAKGNTEVNAALDILVIHYDGSGYIYDMIEDIS